MYHVYVCLTQQHDLRLVVIAGLVCLGASWTALILVRRATSETCSARGAWLTVASAVAGCGIWATHFIAMLAFDTGLPVAYSPGATVLSVLLAVTITGIGFCFCDRTDPRWLWFAGAIVGAGVGVMHYVGMTALQVAAYQSWDAGPVAASLVSGVALTSAALRVAFAGRGTARLAGGALLLTLGICALHFIGMGALQLAPSPLLALPEQVTSPLWLALAVSCSAAAILAAGMLAMVVEHYAGRDAARLRVLVDATFEGVLICADDVILDLNRSLAGLLGCDRETVLGGSLLDLFAPQWVERARAHIASGESTALEAQFTRVDGALVSVELLSRAIDYGAQQARVVAVRDVTDRRRVEEHIRYLAYHDELTGLPNRVSLRENLEAALARGLRSGDLSVLCLDLDRFKTVNDTLGHSAGDRLLKAVAGRIKDCVSDSDLVARLGGDEFAIVQQRVSGSQHAIDLAQNLVEALAKPFDIDGHQFVIGTSVGIALSGDDSMEAETLLKCADQALYRAKTDGRATWRFFDKEMDARMLARRLLEVDLRNAVAADQFEVFYQSLVEARSGVVTGFEALLRWRHPRLGMISPLEFIPLAEEIGVIHDIGTWVLRRACTDAAAWPADLNIAVNLSPVQFGNSALARDVADILAATGLDARRLELEVTESLLLGDNPDILALLHDLRAQGIRIALDDFGTGYSSLSYLRRFPFDKLKIDQSFVRGLGIDAESGSIVRAIVDLGHALHMEVNAEGVETKDQFAALKAIGCDELQGYLFSKPGPAAGVSLILKQPARIPGTQPADLGTEVPALMVA